MNSILRTLVLAVAAFAWTSAPPFVSTSTAGCGCDHPPPNWALVMPAFGSPGTTISIAGDGFDFQVGETYTVDFGHGAIVSTVATGTSSVSVAVPSDVEVGPIALDVEGPGLDHSYHETLFTGLPVPSVLPEADGIWLLPSYEAAVSADGIMMIPFDVSQISAPMQFAFLMGGLRLEFAQDDIVFYNRDGVDLTLFTLDVDDPTERQWGSYYGWHVERDTGIRGDVFRERIRRALLRLSFSDLLTYWRHEFETYKQAHLVGGTHEVDEAGFHRHLGTMHIDHDNLILLIAGKERDFFAPDDPDRSTPLEPGSYDVNLYVGTKIAEHPVEPDDMDSFVHGAIQAGQIAVLSGSSSDDD